MKFTICSVNISTQKGTPKTPVEAIRLRTDMGIEHDAHAGPGHRQVSLLAEESIQSMRDRGISVKAGDFAENITTQELELAKLPVGTVLAVGDTARLRVTQIGKECHARCAIYQQAGVCVMPLEGIFARVLIDGPLKPGQAGWVVWTVGVITVSDRAWQGIYPDQSGPAIQTSMAEVFPGQPLDWNVHLVPDEPDAVELALRQCLNAHCDFILTTGGTGLGPRDQTPEVTRKLADKEVPGLAEAIRAFSSTKTISAALSRGYCGLAGNSLILNLPGSPRACQEIIPFLGPILPHAWKMIRGLGHLANMLSPINHRM